MKKRNKSNLNVRSVISNKVNGKDQLSISGLLLSAAADGYGGRRATTPEVEAQGKAIVREFLAAARDAGFLRGGTAEIVLTSDPVSLQALDIVQKICAHIDNDALILALRRAGIDTSNT